MTIVAIDAVENVIYVDSAHTSSNGRKQIYASKITRHPSGVISAAAGNTWVTQILGELAAALAIKKEPCSIDCPMDRDQAAGSEGILRLPDGEIWSYYVSGEKLQVGRQELLGGWYALGSGADWFAAYMALGHDVAHAVELVALHHAECGGDIERF